MDEADLIWMVCNGIFWVCAFIFSLFMIFLILTGEV